MAKVSVSTDLNVSADQVWKMIGGFNALPDWHPAVDESELTQEGQTRTLSLAGGGTIVEKLEKVDDGARTYTYSIVDSPLPLTNYVSTIRVSGEGDSSTIEWSSQFNADGVPEPDAMSAVQDFYREGFDNLKKMYGG